MTASAHSDAVRAELDQAERSLRSSKVLLDDGDTSGSINRLYYALYHAAKAALIAQGVDIPKTHSGLIAAFGASLVKTGKIDALLGKLLNKVEHERLLADYSGEAPEPSGIPALLQQAELAAVRAIPAGQRA